MFFESLGNFLTGGGWRSNQAREEEEARKQRARAAAAQANANRQSSSGPASFPMFQQGQQASPLQQHLQKPEANLPWLQNPTQPAPNPNTQRLAEIQQSLDDPYRGMSDQDKQIARGLKAKGKNVDRFVESARQAEIHRRKAEHDNNPLVIARDTALAIPRVLAAGAIEAVDPASRVVETVDRLLTGNDDVDRYQKYEDFRGGVANTVDSIAGMPMSFKEDLDIAQRNISTGNGTFSDYLNAGLATLDVTTLGLASRGLKTPAVLLSRLVPRATDNVMSIVTRGLGRTPTPAERELIIRQVKNHVTQPTRTPTPRPGANVPTTVRETRGGQVPATPQASQPLSVPGVVPTAPAQVPGPATQSAMDALQTKLKRPLTEPEKASVLDGQAPKEVIDDASQIGDGISTPSTRAAVEKDVVSTAKVADAEANPALVEAPQPVRPTVPEQLAPAAMPPAPARNVEGLPTKPKGATKKTDDFVEPTAEELAEIESKGLTGRASQGDLEAEFIQDDIDQLSDLIFRRERAGASEATLRPMYAQLDAKRAELRRVVDPPRPTKAQQRAVEQNQRVLEAQQNLERATGAAPKRVAPARSVVPDTPAPKKLPVAAAETPLPKKAPARATSEAPTKQAVDSKAIKPAIEGDKPVVQTVKSKGEVLSETKVDVKPKKAPETQTVKKEVAPAKPKAVAAPKKATAKNLAIQQEKAAAAGKENVKAAVSEKAKALRKANKAVDKATGKEASGRAAKELEKRIRRDFDDPEVRSVLGNLGDSKQALNITEVATKVIKRGAKRSDDQVMADVNDVNFGLGSKASEVDKRIYAGYVAMPRLNRMMKVALEGDNVEAAEAITVAYNNLAKTVTSGASEAGQRLAVESFLAKNATPEMTHARVKKNFEDKGGKMTPEESQTLLDSFTDVATAQGDLETNLDKVSEVMAKFKSSKKAASSKTMKEVEGLKKKNRDLEDILENALAESEKISGELYAANLKSKNIVDDSVGAFGPAYEGWRKASMLSAPTGRFRDLAATAVAVSEKVAVDTLEAAYGKVFRGNARQSMEINSKAVWEGSKEGWERIKQIYSGDRKGGIYVDSGPEGLTRKIKGPQTNLAAAPKKANKAVRAINAASAAPTELFRGYRSNRLRQFADFEGRQLGYSGKKLEQFKDIYEINPSKAVDDMVENDFLTPSAMQKNFIYDGVEKFDSWLRNQAGSIKDPRKRKIADGIVREVGLLTMPFKRYASGSLHRLLTDQNLVHNTFGFVNNAGLIPKKLGGRGLGKVDAQGLSTHAARGTMNTAKVTAATAAILPHLYEEGANGESYSPPYLKVGDNFIPLQSLGPVLAAPFGAAWSNKKFVDTLKDGGNLLEATANWGKSYGTMMFQSTGMDSLVAGDSPIMRLGTNLASGNRQEEGLNWLDRTGGRLLQDVTTQWVPAAARDFNAVLDGLIDTYGGGDGYAPETRVEDEEGNKNYTASGLMTTLAAIPGVRQYLGNINPGDKANATVTSRFYGAQKESEASRHEKEATTSKKDVQEARFEATQERVGALTNDDKIRETLDDETKIIYDRITEGKTRKLKESDYKKVEDGIKKAEDRFLENDDYDTYIKVAESRLGPLKEDPAIEKKVVSKLEFDIKAAKALKDRKVPYALYQQYAGSGKADDETGVRDGISTAEMKKLLDPDGDYYNPELANQLLALDKMMAEKGVSDNSFSVKQPKYLEIFNKLAGKGKKSGGGGSGSGPKVITNVGSVSTLKGEGPKLQYRDVKTWDAPIPNLSKQASKTNFKKNITVKKGVVL